MFLVKPDTVNLVSKDTNMFFFYLSFIIKLISKDTNMVFYLSFIITRFLGYEECQRSQKAKTVLSELADLRNAL